MKPKTKHMLNYIALLALLTGLLAGLSPATPALAEPNSVTIAGELAVRAGLRWRLGPRLRRHPPYL